MKIPAVTRYLPQLLMALVTLVVGILVSVRDPYMLEKRSLDWRFRMRGPQAVDHSDLIIIAVDNTTFKDLPARWPFPRSYYAHLIDNLRRAGVREIMFDIQFTEPDRDNPREDSLLAAAMQKGPKVIHAGQLVEEVRHGSVYQRFDRPIFEDMGIDCDWGLVDDLLEPDGYLRRYTLFVPFYRDTLMVSGQDTLWGKTWRPYLSIGMKLVRDLMAIPDSCRVYTEGGLLHYGGLQIPTDRQARNSMRINYYGPPRTFPTYSFSSVMDDSTFDLVEGADNDYMEIFLNPDLYKVFFPDEPHPFAGKIALIGVSIEDLHDNKFTPFNQLNGRLVQMPGVETHAHAIQTILDRNFIYTPEWWQEYLLQLVLILLVLFLLDRLSPLRLLLIQLPLMGLLIWISVLLFSRFSLWIEIVAPLLVMSLAYLLGVIYRFMQERKNRLQIHSMFSHYVPATLVDNLVKNPDMLQLGGEERELSVLFTDLESFTSVAESMSSPELVQLLNEYLTAMAREIMAEQGTIDKFEGDLIMAEFGTPVWFADHANAACRAALRMRDRLASLRLDWTERGLPELKARIGINSGLMTVGNMGSELIFDFTVMGDAVNLASRLEGINKVYGTYLMISEFTAALISPEFMLRELDIIRVKGKTKPVGVYELVGLTLDLTNDDRERLQAYQQARTLYLERNWTAARDAFAAFFDRWKKDPVGKLYLERSVRFTLEPPEADWDGVVDYQFK